jgi:hypothetical protein
VKSEKNEEKLELKAFLPLLKQLLKKKVENLLRSSSPNDIF